MAFRIASGLFAALFVLSVVVQYNDPDPVRWMLIYGAAAVLSAWGAIRRVPAWAAAGVMLTALIWALTIAPRIAGNVKFSEVFGSVGMPNPIAEEAREALGLLLVALWMAVLALASFRGTIPAVRR